ncbi:MAG: hypothetical protein ACLGHY_14340, partial [Gammaproteobacteria bacterium]
LGDTFILNGTTLTPGFALEDAIYDYLDNARAGLVVDDASGNAYVTASSGSVQRGVDVAAPGGTVFVQGDLKGSFAVGNGLTENSSRARFREVAPGADDLYQANFGNTRSPGRNLLIVAIADEGQRQQAVAILDRFGAVDVDPASASASASATRSRQPR